MVLVELGVAVGTDDEQPRRLSRPYDVAQEKESGLGRPLQVVEDQEDGLVGRRRSEPDGHGIEEPITLGLRVGSERRCKVRYPLGQLGEEPHQLASVATEPLPELMRWGVVHEMAEGLHERLVGDTEILVAASGEECRPLFVDPPGEFGRQPGFPDARFTGEKSDPPLPRRRLLPQLAQPLQLLLSPDEDASDVGQQSRERDRRDRERLPRHLLRGNGRR